MSGNPFDDGSEYGGLGVTNAAEQYVLWCPHLDVPKGWRIVHSCPDRDGALNYVERHFTAAVGAPAA
ncbi:MbtH family NRPS accessory protein [Streptomyces sp. NPDC017260]|uniref:MbtH family NRPS accessory protein n=1 Tax=unclassified Streptomyces TaxID=2593676 RepID=UPI0037B7C186